MSTVAQNLQTLQQIKSDIKNAIINKGQSVGDDMTAYATAISNISGGGGGDKTVVKNTTKFVGEWSQADINSHYDFSTYNGRVSTYSTGVDGYDDGPLGSGLFGGLIPSESTFKCPALPALTSGSSTSFPSIFRTAGNYISYKYDFIGKNVTIDCTDISTLTNYRNFFRGYPARAIVMGNLPNATSLAGLFCNCGDLKSVTMGDINNNLSDVSDMFTNTNKLSTLSVGSVPSVFPVVNTVESLTAYWAYTKKYLDNGANITSLSLRDDVTDGFTVHGLNSSVKEELLDSLSTVDTSIVYYADGDLTSAQIADAESKGWDVSLYEPLKLVESFTINSGHRAAYGTGLTNYEFYKMVAVITPIQAGGNVYIGQKESASGARMFAATTNLYWDWGRYGRVYGSISGNLNTKMKIECTYNSSNYAMTLIAKSEDELTTYVNVSGTGRSYSYGESEMIVGDYTASGADYFTFYEVSFYDSSDNLLAHFVPAVDNFTGKTVLYDTVSGKISKNLRGEEPVITEITE